jgi:hypothetical protein
MTHSQLRKTTIIAIKVLAGVALCIGLLRLVYWLDAKEVPTTTLEKYYIIDP